ncbi:hypothetical protein KXS16_23245 [Olivibacter jilunii]
MNFPRSPKCFALRTTAFFTTNWKSNRFFSSRYASFEYGFIHKSYNLEPAVSYPLLLSLFDAPFVLTRSTDHAGRQRRKKI